MTRRPNWVSAAAIGGAIALLAVSAAPVFAQTSPEGPGEGGYAPIRPTPTSTVAAGTFNGVEYTGNLAKIEATDDATVVFTLCNPDPAFLPKVAFSPFAINDADYLIETGGGGSPRRQPQRHRPLHARRVATR